MGILALFFLFLLNGILTHALNLLSPINLVIVTERAFPDGDETFVTDQNVIIDNAGTQDSMVNFYFRYTQVMPTNYKMKILIQHVQPNKNLTIGKPILINFCDFVNNDKLLYPGFREHSNLPAKCPMKADFYKVLKYRPPIEKFPPILPIGKYMARLQLVDESKVMQQLIWIGSIQYKK